MEDVVNFSDFMKNKPILENSSEINTEEEPTKSKDEPTFNPSSGTMITSIPDSTSLNKNDESESELSSGTHISQKDIIQSYKDDNSDSKIKEEEKKSDSEVGDNDDKYKIFKDKNENFTCNIEVEGVSILNTSVRLVVQSKDWNIFFTGEIDKNGKVTVPMKKMSFLEEGSTGTIKMEIIADENIFTPWEQEFIVKLSKKITVKTEPETQKDTKPKIRMVQ